MRGRLGPERLRWRRLGLTGCALSPERHATQPHEVGLETRPPPSPHRRRQERADRGPLRGGCRRPNPRGPGMGGNQGLISPSSAHGTRLGCGVLAEWWSGMQRQLPSGSVRAGSGLLALGAARRGGDAAGSPARSTLHPPGHCPERLQDRQRVGAGNYKSNSSSRGIKLQRKRTSQGKKKKQGEGVQRLSGFPCAPGTDPGKLQKSPKETGERTKVTPKRRGGSPRGSFGVLWGS